MPQYLFALSSERSTFTMSFDATDDEDAVRHAIGFVVKARIARLTFVKVVRPDKSEMDISKAVAPYLDKPEL